MKTIRIMAATAAGFSMLITPALAACVSTSDALALKTAAVQQELMVAAFTCGDTEGYNRFVIAYQPELQASDATLLAYFQRTGSTADYHSYKTSLANDFSLISVRNRHFCGAASAAFDEALSSSHPALAQVVGDQPVMVNEDGGSCGVHVAASDRAMLPHEDETPDSSAETVSGGSWAGQHSRAPN